MCNCMGQKHAELDMALYNTHDVTLDSLTQLCEILCWRQTQHYPLQFFILLHHYKTKSVDQ